MILTIWRHGEAGQAPRDHERTLTDRGCDDIGFGAQQFHVHSEARGIPHPDRIGFSPWTRTRQTADIIAAAFTHAACSEEQRIQPGASLADALRLVQDVLDEGFTEHLVLVSHQPLVSRIIDALLGDVGRVPPLTPGGLAVIDVDVAEAATARLLFWSLPPDYGTGA